MQKFGAKISYFGLIVGKIEL